MQEHEYEVQQILAAKFSDRANRYYYLVKWLNWSLEDCTWEPEDNLGNAADMLDQFKDRQARNQVDFKWWEIEKLSLFWRDEERNCKPALKSSEGQTKRKYKKIKKDDDYKVQSQAPKRKYQRRKQKESKSIVVKSDQEPQQQRSQIKQDQQEQESENKSGSENYSYNSHVRQNAALQRRIKELQNLPRNHILLYSSDQQPESSIKLQEEEPEERQSSEDKGQLRGLLDEMMQNKMVNTENSCNYSKEEDPELHSNAINSIANTNREDSRDDHGEPFTMIGIRRTASSQGHEPIKYLVKHNEDNRKLWLTQEQAYRHCPISLIKYYQSKLVFANRHPPKIQNSQSPPSSSQQ